MTPDRRLAVTVTALAALVMAGCVSYQPRPLDLSQTAQALEHRDLSDPGLLAYIEASRSAPPEPRPPASWDFTSLTLAALYFSADLARDRAELGTAEAEAFAVGLRQDPGLSFTVEQRVSNLQGAPASTWGPTLDIPLTTGGKRAVRQAEAGARVRASRSLLDHTAWQVRSELRSALVARDDAAARVEVEEALADASDTALALWQARLAAGEASAPEVERARADAAAARLALARARAAREEALARLARSVGVPEAALEGLTLPSLEQALPQPPSVEEARQTALLTRSDLLAALSYYAASDQALRLAVRSQYPDLVLSPGYLWDQGADAWVLGVSALLPLIERNRGNIARAEAAREVEGSKVLALQESILHDIEAAQVAYSVALATLAQAGAQERSRSLAVDAAEKALAAGAGDALGVALARSGWETARLEALDARHSALNALGRLEDALERPIAPDQPMPQLPGGQPPAKENAP